MTAFTSTSNSAADSATHQGRFLIACQDHTGAWKKLGFVTKKNNKFSVDKEVSDFIRVGTTNRERLLQSCKFLVNEPAATDVCWEPTRKWTTYRTIRAF